MIYKEGYILTYVRAEEARAVKVRAASWKNTEGLGDTLTQEVSKLMEESEGPSAAQAWCHARVAGLSRGDKAEEACGGGLRHLLGRM